MRSLSQGSILYLMREVRVPFVTSHYTKEIAEN